MATLPEGVGLDSVLTYVDQTHKWDGEFHTMDIEVKSFEQFGGAEIV